MMRLWAVREEVCWRLRVRNRHVIQRTRIT
jgi:hypothetical protein